MHPVSVSTGPARRIRTTYVARVVALLLILMLLAQLFGYESFSSLLLLLLPFNDHRLTELVAAGLVLAELLTIPYLLAMPLSLAMRLVCAGCGSIVMLFWVFTQLTSAHAGNAALFSDTIALPGGLLALLFSLVLAAGFGYVAVADATARTS